MTTRTSTTAACLLAACAATTASAQEPAIALERDTIRDKMAVTKEAIALLRPKGWTLEGGIVWYPHHVHQANAEARVRNPKGLEQVEFLPYKAHCWMSQWVVPFPRGSNYLGTEVQPPTDDPREYVQSYVLPRHRAGAKVTGYKELPEVARAVANSPAAQGCTVRAGRTRIEYQVGDQTVEEDVYAVLYMHKTNLGGVTMWNWGAERLFAVRAEKGKLDARSNLLVAIANSAKINPNWFAEYMYVCDLFKNRMYQGIANAAALSRTISENSEHIRKLYSDAYRARQESQDRISTQFSNYIRGVENYHSPYERYPVQLPSGYNHVWANASGQYLLSNSANFNPNVGSTQSWQQLKVAQ